LTLTSGSGTIKFGSSTLQRVAAGATIIDLSDTLSTSLKVTNSGLGGVADLNLDDGGLKTGGTTRLSNTGVLQNITGLTATGGASLSGGLNLNGDGITNAGTLSGITGLSNNGDFTLSLNSTLSDTTLTVTNPSLTGKAGLDVEGGAIFGGAVSVGSGGANITGSLTASGTITFGGLNSAGVVHTDITGKLSTSKVALGGDTSGNYVATLSAGTGLSGGGSGVGSAAALNVLYGSTAGTAVQGSTSLTCASGTGNLTGGGTSITLGSGGTCAAIGISSTPSFTSVTATGTVQAATVNATSVIQLAGTNINTAGTLTNVAYKNQANTFTGVATFSSAGTALSVTNNATIGGNLAVGSLRIGASATAGYVLTADASGNATWAPQKIQAVYNGNTITSGNNIIWTTSVTTTSGVATVSLPVGVFTNILSAQATAVGGSTAINSPVASVRSVTASSITVAAMVGKNIASCGGGLAAACPATDTFVYAPNGTTVYITVIGN
jgi:hypothetical protein